MTETEKLMVEKKLDRLASIPASAMMMVRIPLVLLLDCSGSMRRFHNVLKAIVTELCGELKFGTLFDFTLCVIMIHNSVPRLFYLGELFDFDESAFVENMPEEYGMTPLASAYTMAEELLHRVSQTLESQRHWHTIPVFLSFTDTEENGSLDDVSDAKARFRRDIAESKKLLIEFVTADNPDGLDLGGYRVPIKDTSDLDTVKRIMEILRYMSTTTVKQGDSLHDCPMKSDRLAYCRYKSDMLLFNFKIFFENYYSE